MEDDRIELKFRLSHGKGKLWDVIDYMQIILKEKKNKDHNHQLTNVFHSYEIKNTITICTCNLKY